MHELMDIASFAVIPVLILHMFIDLFDKHRHGIKIHDKVGIVAYIVLAMHFALDLREFF